WEIIGDILVLQYLRSRLNNIHTARLLDRLTGLLNRFAFTNLICQISSGLFTGNTISDVRRCIHRGRLHIFTMNTLRSRHIATRAWQGAQIAGCIVLLHAFVPIGVVAVSPAVMVIKWVAMPAAAIPAPGTITA